MGAAFLMEFAFVNLVGDYLPRLASASVMVGLPILALETVPASQTGLVPAIQHTGCSTAA